MLHLLLAAFMLGQAAAQIYFRVGTEHYSAEVWRMLVGQ
jgi:hypothetical protein